MKKTIETQMGLLILTVYTNCYSVELDPGNGDSDIEFFDCETDARLQFARMQGELGCVEKWEPWDSDPEPFGTEADVACDYQMTELF